MRPDVDDARVRQLLDALDGWRDRSPFVGTWGALQVRHFDFRLQALAKLERGLETDLDDVRMMLDRRLVVAAELQAGFDAMLAELFRFPAVDAARFQARVADIIRRR